jgi:flagellar basal-body rod modification protein FlgD
MSISSINNYWTKGVTVAGESGKDSSKNTLDMNDFFSLLVAQMSNQDMYNTMDDTQFIAQMAQFSMVQALSDLSTLTTTNYSVSLIGKEVALASYADDGSVSTINGIVEGVTLYNGSAQIVVDGTNYSLSSIMAVREPTIIIPDPEVKDDTKDKDDTTDTKETSGTGTSDDGDTSGTGVSGTEDTSGSDSSSGSTEGDGDV